MGRVKKNQQLTQLDVIVLGLCDIAEGLATVCSLGFFRPDLELRYHNWRLYGPSRTDLI